MVNTNKQTTKKLFSFILICSLVFNKTTLAFALDRNASSAQKISNSISNIRQNIKHLNFGPGPFLGSSESGKKEMGEKQTATGGTTVKTSNGASPH